MLFVDPTEVRGATKMVLSNDSYTVVPDLEAMTGADFMISPVNFPATTATLVKRHLASGAVLVQRKHRLDLVSSIRDDRLKTSILRMRSIGARPPQCILLIIGVITERSGKAVIDGQPLKQSYWAINGAVSSWMRYGGVVALPLSKASLIPEWCAHKLNELYECARNPIKEFVPAVDPFYEWSSDDIFQEPVAVTDWRRAISTCPGWGPVAIEKLSQFIIEKGHKPSLVTALAYMTSKEILSVSGIGPAAVEKARRWAGLGELQSTRFFELMEKFL